MNPILAGMLGAPEGYDTTAWDGPDLYVQTPNGMGRLGNMDPSTEDYYSAKNSPLYYQGEGGLWQLYGQNNAGEQTPTPNQTVRDPNALDDLNKNAPKSSDIYNGWGGGAPVGQPGMVYGGPSQSMQIPGSAGGSMGASPYGGFWNAFTQGYMRQSPTAPGAMPAGPTPYGGLPSLVQGAGKAAAE